MNFESRDKTLFLCYNDGMDAEIMKIEDLGYDGFFESNRTELGLDGFEVARVVAEHRGGYRVRNANGEYPAKITGKQIWKAASREDYPAVGDWVAISEADKEQWVIRGVLPRRTIIKRKYGDRNRVGEKSEVQVIAANVDVAFIVESVGRDFNLNRFERYFAIAKDGGVKPAMILNKIDLIPQEELDSSLSRIKERFGDIDVIATSTKTLEGLEELKKYIVKGKTYCFLGSSGVGKSTLINRLLGSEAAKTGDIGSLSGRGRHVTTSREMYFLADGGIVIDNPGVREVGMTDALEGIDELFDEIAALAEKCKYTDCTHIQEPGCNVLSELESGKLDKEKYSNYISLKKEAEHHEMSRKEKKEKDRQFGKFIKKAKKELNSSGHKDF
ncbi:MAG: ribosome small subunit-dependent GTPase A [Candidatus Moranbacteria bacterium]|nr:ribosome small subunit-dependent GTPase A [Candidatus Moranbacteria bacterium]